MHELKLIKCPTCEKEISFNADTCPKCGQPISNDIRDAAVKERAITIKNRRIGCLCILLFIIAYCVYEHFNSPRKMFIFNEEQFMSVFLKRSSQNSIIKKYGIINALKSETGDSHTVFTLNNNDGELHLYKYKKEEGKIHEIVIKYDDKKPYNELTIVGAVEAVCLSLVDFGYIPLSDFDNTPRKLSRDIMSLPRNERETVGTAKLKYKFTKYGGDLPVMTIEMAPIRYSISFEAEEGAIKIRFPKNL